MADTLKLQISASFIQETPPMTMQLMNKTQEHSPVSYQHGIKQLIASQSDYQIANSVHLCVLTADDAFDVKIGSTTETPLTTKAFVYNGSAKDIFLTNNSSTDVIEINFVTSSV